MSARNLRITIVWREKYIREALKNVLQERWEFATLNCFSAISDLHENKAVERDDIIFLDARKMDQSCIDAIAFLVGEGGRVMLLSDHLTSDEVLSVLRFGASACVPPESSCQELIDITTVVMGGGVYIRREAANLLVQTIHRDDDLGEVEHQKRRHNLSPREFALLRELKNGRSNKEIARELMISESAVKLYLRHLLRKLNARNRTEAVSVGMQMGLLSNGNGIALVG